MLTKLLFTVIFVLLQLLAGAQNIFSYEKSIEYTWHLINQEKNEDAHTELKRIAENFALTDTVKYLMIYNALRYKPADFFTLSRSFNNDHLKEELLRYIIINAFEADSITLAEEMTNNSGASLSLKNSTRFHSALHMYDTVKAKSLMKELIPGNDCISPDSIYKRLISISRKKHAPAMAMSAVIPGSGRIYAGQPFDGIISFIAVGMFSFQSYSGFSHKGIGSAYGWIYGGAALAFYAGNIYGSYQAVSRFNAVQLNHFRNDLALSLHCYINQ